MNERWDWGDLRAFIAVARQGGLAKAAPFVGLSAPTLTRRMRGLERALGISLFRRHRDGYELTRNGEELLELAEALERGALNIDRWRSAAKQRTSVKIAAGAWTSLFVARHMGDLVHDDDHLAVEIVTAVASADLLRREANLGLRNQRPAAPGLAARKLTRVEFAVYGGKAYLHEHPEAHDGRRFAACRWIGYSPSGPKAPSAAWLDRQLNDAIWLTCSTAEAVLQAAVAGGGLCVLPCFVGDVQPALGRASDIIAELGHEQWLVSHDDDRHIKEIRLISDRLAKLARTHEALLRGQLPA